VAFLPLRGVLAATQPHAGAALSLPATTVLRARPHRVLRGELMAALAVRFRHLTGCVDPRRLASRRVLSMADRLKMGGIHAQRVAAEVVEFLIPRDGSDEKLIGESVCPDWPAVDRNDPVEQVVLALPAARFRTGPQPALALASPIDLRPESRLVVADDAFSPFGARVAGSPPAHVVHPAHIAPHDGLLASGHLAGHPYKITTGEQDV
jgi:hypothetical protein